MFGNRNKEKMLISNIEYIEDLKNKKELELAALLSKINEMKVKVEQFKNEYGLHVSITELKAEIKRLEETLIELEESIKKKEKEMKALNEQIGLLNELLSIKKLKVKIEEERKSLENLKREAIPVKDIIFCFNRQDGDLEYFDGIYLIIPFRYVDTLEYEFTNDKVLVYQSLAQDYTIMFDSNRENNIYNYEYDTEKYITNMGPETWHTFSEICIMLGSSFYLKGFVTPEEIDSVLKDFMEKYKIEEDDDYNIRIIKRNQNNNNQKNKRTRQK